MGLKATFTVFNAAAVTTTTTFASLSDGAGVVLDNAASMIIDVETTGFSGTLDFQGRESPTAARRNVAWQEIDNEGSSGLSATNDQISYTTETSTHRYLVPIAARDMQVIMTRSAGSITLNVTGVGTQLQSPFPSVALAGSATGDQKRDEFIHDFLATTADCRLLVLPKLTDTTTSTSVDSNARTVTWDATIAARMTTRGSGVALDFAGVSDEGDMPDTDNLTFGDSLTDGPFSVLVVVNADTISGIDTFIAKHKTNHREYVFDMSAGGPRLVLYDQSAAANIGRGSTAITASTWTFVAGTYDGSAASTGIKTYINAAQVDNANVNSGTYIAMENKTSVVQLAHRLNNGTDAVENLLDAKAALFAIVAGTALTVSQLWTIKALINAYFDLSL